MVLRDNLLMAGLVHRDFEKEVAQHGDTVRTRKPEKLTVQSFSAQAATTATMDGSGLTVQNLNSREVTVVLDQHRYTAFIVEDRDAATSIKDLKEEFIVPAIDPISQQVDDDVLTEYITGTDVDSNAITDVAQTALYGGNSMDEGDIIEARRALNASQCPQQGRSIVLSTEHEADVLGRALFHQANTAGTTEALRNANLGRAFGFDTFMSQNVPDGSTTDGTAQSLAFHKNVMALVTRPLPDIPAGLGAVASNQTIDGIGVRVTNSYGHTAKGVVISFDILYGVQLLDANLGVLIVP